MVDKQKPENILLEGVVGSTAYGLNTPTSDIDIKGIYAAPLLEVLGLDGPERVSETRDNTGPDWSYHEVGKFLKLALKCNPSVLELLWLEDYKILTSMGAELVKIRERVLSEPAIRGAYGAYAKAQAERLMRRQDEGKEGFSSDTKARTEKHGRHCMRLLIQGSQLLVRKDMQVNVSEQREWLFDMGQLAATNPDKFYQNYQNFAAEFDAIDSILPSHPDRKAVELTLIMVRIDELLTALKEDAAKWQ